jgi:hypothetical protein
MSRVSLAKDAQLRETLISADRGGENLASQSSKSWWRSSSSGALAAAPAIFGPKKERIGGDVVFDPFTDLRPLNYKQAIDNTATGSKIDQVEGR